MLDLDVGRSLPMTRSRPLRRHAGGSAGHRRAASGVTPGAQSPLRRGSGGRRGRAQNRRLPAKLPGRWSIPVWSTPPIGVSAAGDARATRRLAGLAAVLLERHAVVTRSAMTAERVAGGFAAIYRVLAAMEDTGGCIRTYAVEGLGAAQFTTPAVVDRLRACAAGAPTQTPVLLASTDPAQVYGAALSWPARPGQDIGHRPGRKAGAILVQVDGEPILYLERGGRTLLTWPTDSAPLDAAVDCLAAAISSGRLPTATITKVDGVDAFAAPIAPQLLAAGFRQTPRGLRLRTGAR